MSGKSALSSMSNRAVISHSIVICTVGRLEELFITVRDLDRMITYPDITEVIIVNNGEEAATTKIEHKLGSLYLDKKIRWNVIHEQRPGLSNARNAALAVVDGEIVTFLDDDASPKTTEWQESILKVFRLYPEVGMCGGPSELVVPNGYPANPWWRSTYTDELFSCRSQFKSGACEPDHIYGLNASYRRTCLERCKFNPGLGWNKSRKHAFSGEETLLNKQISQSGWCAWYESKAIVLHRIEPERYNTKWLLRRCFIKGRSYGLLIFMNEEASVTLYDALRSISIGGLKLVARVVQFKFNRGFYHLCRVCDNLGLVSFMLQNKRTFRSSSTYTDKAVNINKRGSRV